MNMKGTRGYLSPIEYADRSIPALERAMSTEVTLQEMRVPVLDLITEVRALRSRNQVLEEKANRLESTVERLRRRLTVAMNGDAAPGITAEKTK